MTNQNRIRKWRLPFLPVPDTVMRKLGIILLLSITCTFAVAQSAEDQEVLTLSSRKFDWLIRKQADSLDRMLDERLQYIHSNGWIQNKQEVLDDMRSGKLVYVNVKIKESFARTYGKAAVVTGLGTFEGVNGGNPFKLDLRYTEVYTWTATGWKLVSRHSNRMP